MAARRHRTIQRLTSRNGTPNSPFHARSRRLLPHGERVGWRSRFTWEPPRRTRDSPVHPSSLPTTTSKTAAAFDIRTTGVATWKMRSTTKRPCIHPTKQIIRPHRRGGRVVEGAPLLREYTSKAYRGFESLPLRHIQIPRHLQNGYTGSHCPPPGRPSVRIQ